MFLKNEDVNSNTIKALLNIPSLKPDVQLLRRMEVYERAVREGQEYVM